MRDKELIKYLRQSLQRETEPEKKPDLKPVKLEETVRLCTEIVREQSLAQSVQKESRTGFVRYLSDIFRFEGLPVLGLQAIALFIVCFTIYTASGIPKYIPIFMPLLVLAVIPVMFRCQYYGMSEIEAVTRASGTQIVLAKLVLAGAANIVCMTVFVALEVNLRNSYREIGQIILYCLVPYLVCMVSMLRLIRLQRKESLQLCMIITLGSCVCWGILTKVLPWLYETSALGIWIVAFLFFAAFFIKEIYYIITMRKEGKMYGIIA